MFCIFHNSETQRIRTGIIIFDFRRGLFPSKYIKITVEEWPIVLPQGHKIELKLFAKKMQHTIYRGCLQFVWVEPYKSQYTPLNAAPSWVAIDTLNTILLFENSFYLKQLKILINRGHYQWLNYSIQN